MRVIKKEQAAGQQDDDRDGRQYLQAGTGVPEKVNAHTPEAPKLSPHHQRPKAQHTRATPLRRYRGGITPASGSGSPSAGYFIWSRLDGIGQEVGDFLMTGRPDMGIQIIIVGSGQQGFDVQDPDTAFKDRFIIGEG